MINMIRADLYRILRSPAFYIAFLLIAIMATLNIYLVQPGQLISVSVADEAEPYGNKLDNMSYEDMQKLTMKDMREIMLESTNYKLDVNVLKQNMNVFFMFIFAAVLAVTCDFSAGSIKNTLSSAISRKKYFISKLVVVFGIVTLMFFFNTYINYFGNIIFNNKNLASDIGEITKITFMQLPVAYAGAAVLFGLSFIIRKTAVYNTVTIAGTSLGVPLLLSAAAKILSIKPEKVARFELGSLFYKMASSPSHDYIVTTFIGCAVIMIVSIAIGWMFFRKNEIK